MLLCAHRWLILSGLLVPQRYFPACCFVTEQKELCTCYWEPDWKAWSRNRSSSDQVRAAADTVVAWFARLHLWTASNGVSDTALSSGQHSSTDKNISHLLQRWPRTMSQLASSENQNGPHHYALQMNSCRQYLLKVADKKRGMINLTSS